MSHAVAESRTNSVRQQALPWALVVAWLLLTALAFWYFELRHQRAFSTASVTLFDSEARISEAEQWARTLIPASASTATLRATVVHVARTNCPCNRFAEPHLEKIEADYATRGVRFVRATGSLPVWIESTPAALIFDARGKLIYFGPYSDSAWCGVSGGLVERVLDQVLSGQVLRPQRLYSQGCFCGQSER
jgi:hypothetical protein